MLTSRFFSERCLGFLCIRHYFCCLCVAWIASENNGLKSQFKWIYNVKESKVSCSSLLILYIFYWNVQLHVKLVVKVNSINLHSHIQSTVLQSVLRFKLVKRVPCPFYFHITPLALVIFSCWKQPVSLHNDWFEWQILHCYSFVCYFLHGCDILLIEILFFILIAFVLTIWVACSHMLCMVHCEILVLFKLLLDRSFNILISAIMQYDFFS